MIGSQETLDEYVAETWAPTHAVTLAPSDGEGLRGAVRHAHRAVPRAPEADRDHAGGDRALAGRAARRGRRARLDAQGAARCSGRSCSGRSSPSGSRATRCGWCARSRRPPKSEVRPLAPVTIEAMRAASEHARRDADLGAGLRRAAAAGGARACAGATSASGRCWSTRRRPASGATCGCWRRCARTLARVAQGAGPLSDDAGRSRRARRRAGRRTPTRAGRARLHGDAADGRGLAQLAPGPFARAAQGRECPTRRRTTLRHRFCSLLLHEGRSVIYVARQLGHDAALTLSTYGHVIDELDDAPRIAAEDAIGPRARPVCHRCATRRGRRCVTHTPSETPKPPPERGVSEESRRPDSNRRPLHYE